MNVIENMLMEIIKRIESIKCFIPTSLMKNR